MQPLLRQPERTHLLISINLLLVAGGGLKSRWGGHKSFVTKPDLLVSCQFWLLVFVVLLCFLFVREGMASMLW